uniref:MFS domain-containing protein n=1 Tax=Rhabditophanes sp. KR3021 TaxID=114890 RepID=A0AC35TP94_9BILA
MDKNHEIEPLNFERAEPTPIKKSFSTFTKSEWITFLLILFTNVNLQMSITVILPFFAEVATKKGLTLSEIGLIFGIFSLVRKIGDDLPLNNGDYISGFLYDVGGYQHPFMLVSLLLIINTVLVFIYIRDFEMEEEHHPHSHKQQFGFKQIAAMPYVWFMLLTTCIVGAMFNFISPILPSALERFDLSSTELGVIFFLSGAVYSLSVLVIGPILHRFNIIEELITFGLGLCSVSLVFLGPVTFIPIDTSIPLVVMSLILQGMAGSALFLTSFKLAIDIITIEYGYQNNVNTNGIASGIFSAFYALGNFNFTTSLLRSF